MNHKKTLEIFLKESTFDQFISIDDFTPVDNMVVQLKLLSEINNSLKFYFITEGYMDLFFPDKNGKNHLMSRVYPKDLQLGGVQTYFNNEYVNLNDFIVSLSKDARLYEVNSKKITQLLNDPSFLKFIFEKFSTFLFKVIRENYFKSIFTLDEYLAYILFYHSINNEYIVENYSIFTNLLKCDRTNLYRSLTSLENLGIIKKDGKKIKILSMEALKYLFEEKI